MPAPFSTTLISAISRNRAVETSVALTSISMIRVVCFFCLFLPLVTNAQIECPSMGITNERVRTKAHRGGFMVRVGDHRTSAKADLFVRPVSARNRGPMADAFVSKRGSGRFRDQDAFSTKRSRGSLFDGSDHFLSRKGRSPRYRSDAGFGNHRYRSAIDIEGSTFGNTSGRSGTGATKGMDHFRQRRKSRNLKRHEPQPFQFQRQPPPPPRDPQMGLWGGTIGRRGREPKRPNTPLPKSEDKKEGGN